MSRAKTLGAMAHAVDSLLRAQREQLAREAVRVYAETKSLRKAAERLNVSHETVRQLLKEAEREAA